MSSADPATVPGLPESALAAGDLAGLPGTSPPAPWTCRARSLIWLQRGSPPEFDWIGTPLPLCAVALVDYLESPVGPYREVLAGALVRRGPALYLQVPFIAVDSLASVHGGRANWALPKTVAGFDGDLGAGQVTATGAGWSIKVRAEGKAEGTAPGPPRIPVPAAFPAAGPLGRYWTTIRARGRLVRIRTQVQGPTLAPWLGDGRHLALIAEGRMRIGKPG